MRTHKELLVILLDNIHLLKTGLCSLIFDLYTVGMITMAERFEIRYYIYNNRPSNLYSIFSTRYFWKKGARKPRIKWLKNQIAIETNII